MTTRIPRKLVEQFIARKKLQNVGGFLRFVVQSSHAIEFAKYARRHGRSLPFPDNLKGHLFHGSQQRLKRLAIPPSGERFVYATDDPNYAIFLAVLNLKNAGARVTAARGKTNLIVDVAFVNGPSTLKSGWVHVVPKKYFKKTGNSEYISAKPADVFFSILVMPSDLTEPIVIRKDSVRYPLFISTHA